MLNVYIVEIIHIVVIHVVVIQMVVIHMMVIQIINSPQFKKLEHQPYFSPHATSVARVPITTLHLIWTNSTAEHSKKPCNKGK
jgi:hypothetical protein